ncbi:replication protein A 70 kDa DNA-binding subunit B [Daucus carota subsp. sativus]|uniref:replication protein A 70 kDa DNA-binding subunit B n=1 Tax=Daucus carota subsp. sativus TaxID=79200 RepID=UPI003083416E
MARLRLYRTASPIPRFSAMRKKLSKHSMSAGLPLEPYLYRERRGNFSNKEVITTSRCATMSPYSMLSALSQQSDNKKFSCELAVYGKQFQDDHILAIVRNNQRDAFLPMLKENEVYSFHANKMQNEEKMLVTLWEDKALQFMSSILEVQEKATFVAITGLLAKKFSDRATLSSTDATRSYFNIDYEPLNALNEKLSASMAGGHNSLQAPTTRQFVTANENQPKELQTKSILEAKIPVGNNVLHCLYKGTIVDVLNGNGWYYICCPKCARAVRELEGKFYCAACTEEPNPVTQRYRVVIRIEDGTGSTTLTLFNKEAEQIIGAPLNILLKEIEKEMLAEIPLALKNLIGKKCAFQIKITPYNIEKSCEEYTVTRVSEFSLPPITNDAADSSEGSNKKQRTA